MISSNFFLFFVALNRLFYVFNCFFIRTKIESIARFQIIIPFVVGVKILNG